MYLLYQKTISKSVTENHYLVLTKLNLRNIFFFTLLSISIHLNAALPSLPPFQLPPIKIVTEDFPPYNYEKDGKIQGFSTAIIKEVCLELGINNPNIQVYPWIRAYKLTLESPNVLIYTISKIQMREPLFKWAGQIAPGNNFLYSKSTTKTLSINSLSDARKKRIGTVKGSVRDQYLLDQGFKQGINLFPVNNDNQNFNKLMKGRLDLWAANELNIYYLLHNRHKVAITIVKREFQLDIQPEMQMAFGKLTDDRVVERFKRALQAIKDNGTYSRIFKEHFHNIIVHIP